MRGAIGITVLLWAGASVVAFAAEDSWTTPDELRLSRADCARLVVHEPAPDVAYRPGVDVHGRAVAPADLNGGARMALPEEIVIPLEMNVLRGRRWGPSQEGGAQEGGALEGEAALGTVVVRNGKAYFNGEPLHGWEQEVLAEACRKLGVR